MSDLAKDPWAKLRAATPARIGLGRAGAAMPTKATLEFQFAHARARDAVHSELNVEMLAKDLLPLETMQVASAAADRVTYLRRPDLGRTLGRGEAAKLTEQNPCDIAFVVADGLSSTAMQSHAAPVIRHTLPKLQGLGIGPVIIATQARVAIGDEIGAAIGAKLTVLLVGERPGLTVADSLGAYLTYEPRPGTRDSARNCLSNIHTQGGMDYETAATKIAWLCREALRRGLTGTGLKENAAAIAQADSGPALR